MAQRRKDAYGRVLKDGESQRKDSLYQYRYTDPFGKRKTVYARTLRELRDKEDKINVMRRANVDYSAGDVTVLKLVERYLNTKCGVRYSTAMGYASAYNRISLYPISQMSVRDVKVSDAKQFVIDMYYKGGYSHSTISSTRGLVRMAFEMAYEEDIVLKNPFNFRLDIIPNNTKKREALTREQQESFLKFIREHNHYSQYYDEYLVLLGTGMRISEFCGLTKDDLDFKNRRIRVNHQIGRKQNGERYINETKSEAGIRFIPMTTVVEQSLRNILKKRIKPKEEPVIDGLTGFLLLDKKGDPKVANHYQKSMQRAVEAYNKCHDVPLPKTSPHVFRHSFCTNMADAGMDCKNLQYLMGHSEVDITLNVYTHTNYEKAEQAMAKIDQIPALKIGGLSG